MNNSTDITTYLSKIPTDKIDAFNQLRATILANIPNGFEETFNYGMIGYIVPHNIYPNGYHCDKKQALPFANIAVLKSGISLYHMAIYADNNLLDWFVNEYPKHCTTKLDMGKSCIRFKDVNKIPFALIEELIQKVTVQDWIQLYEKAFVKN